MSTRSLIARQTQNGIEAVYCHCDGHPKHHLPILRKHYADDAAVAALLALGDLSVLGPELGEKHDFRTHGEGATENWCLAYGRDRGEKDTAARKYPGETEFLEAADKSWAAFIYLFADGQWRWRSVHGDAKWRTRVVTE